MNIRKILVPVDFSVCSRELVADAVELAQRLGARVVLLHVVRLPAGVDRETLLQPDPDAPPVSALDHLLADARAQMARYPAADVFEGTVVKHLVEEGQIVETILSTIEDLHVDLVVMGSRGLQGVARWMFGSVAESVLRQSRVPVMVFRTQHKPTCEARSCAVCRSGTTGARIAVSTEAEG
jgi:nucleotide-binding universal stress UspA family protein